MTEGSHITRLGGVNEEISSGFESSANQVKVSIDGKFSKINLQLKDIKKSFASTVNDLVTESKCEKLEARLFAYDLTDITSSYKK